MADSTGPNPNAPPFIPGGQAFGLGLADMGTHISPEEHMMAMSQRAPPGLVPGCGYNRPAPPTEPPPMPPGASHGLPGLNFGLGLLGPTLGPGLIPGPPGRQPQHHHPIGAGPIGAVGGAIGPAPQMGPDWGRHPMQPMHQQLPQQMPPQQMPQQMQQLPQHFQPKAVGCSPPMQPMQPMQQMQQMQPMQPMPAPDAFHQNHAPAPEVQTPPVKPATLPRETPLQEVSPEPSRQEREEPERKSGEKYVPPAVKRYSHGENRTENRPENRTERTDKIEKREEKVEEKVERVEKVEKPEKVEKVEKHEKRFEAAAIERRRVSSDSWDESAPVRATTPPGVAAGKIEDKENPKVRTDLMRAVFRACDTNGDDWLGESEFRQIARFYGFSGSDEKWSEEFKKLCEEKNVDPKKGIGQTLFSKLLNEDDGLMATTEDLRKMLKKLEDNNKKALGASKEAAKAQGASEEGDEFFHKLKRTVNWYNKHGNLTAPIGLNQVAEVLSEIKPNQAMKILYDLDTAKDKESLQDPTNWIIAEAKKRRQANEQPKGKGDGKGEEKDGKTNHKTESKPEKPDAVPEWRSQDANDKNAKGGAATKGAGKGKAEEPEEETDQFRAKMKRTINWYNRHGHLCAPIRFQEVITTLGSTDPRVAMRILNDLDQANAEAVLSDPTKWIIEECRRRAPGAPGDKGAPNSQNSGTRTATDVPQPKPLALSKLGGLTAVPTRLGPPKKDPAAATVPAATP